MVQRVLLLFLIYIIAFIFPCSSCCTVFAEETQSITAEKPTPIKVNSINFDNSDSIIFLGTTVNNDSDEIKITKKVLSEPDRVFFDIENAIITFPNKTFQLKNSRLTQLKIAQNSTDPNIVRVVIWNAPEYDASQIKVLKAQILNFYLR